MGTNERGKVVMSEGEIAAYVATQRTATLATHGPTGQIHLVGMWFAVLDGTLWFETKAKSQKTRNLLRDPRATVLIEDGLTYDTLRGVSFEGRGVVVEDPDAIWSVGVNVWERYSGEYTEDARPLVEMMLNNRIAIRFDVERTRSWDHRKLGLGHVPLSGSTAEHVPGLLRSRGED